MRKFLVSGTRQGLGKYLQRYFSSLSLTRDTKEGEFEQLKNEGVDCIIHSAFNPAKNILEEDVASYINDNVFLTKKLLDVSHERFVFISSIEVYPYEMDILKEDRHLELGKMESSYAITKLMSECLVRELAVRPLILRCPALLGHDARKNSLTRILLDECVKLSLAGSSTFNYILHSDISYFIERAIEKDAIGVYNVASSENVSLAKVAERFQRKVDFGDFVYKTGKIDNGKAIPIHGGLSRSSMESIELFMGIKRT